MSALQQIHFALLFYFNIYDIKKDIFSFLGPAKIILPLKSYQDVLLMKVFIPLPLAAG